MLTYAYLDGAISERTREEVPARERCNSHCNDLRGFVRRRHLHVCIRQHTSAHTSAYVTLQQPPQRPPSLRAPKAPAFVGIRPHTSAIIALFSFFCHPHLVPTASAYVSIRQHPSCAEGTCIWCQQRQHTSAYVAHTSASVVRRRHLHLVPTAPLPHSIRQHTSAYTSAYVSTCIWCQQRHCRIAYVCIRQRIRQHTSAPASGANSATAACRGRSLETADTCHPPAAPASIRQHTQHTSAYVSIRQHTSA
jgi:hypothetical protein